MPSTRSYSNRAPPETETRNLVAETIARVRGETEFSAAETDFKKGRNTLCRDEFGATTCAQPFDFLTAIASVCRD